MKVADLSTLPTSELVRMGPGHPSPLLLARDVATISLRYRVTGAMSTS